MAGAAPVSYLAIDPGAAGGIAWTDQYGIVRATKMPDTMPEQVDFLRERAVEQPGISGENGRVHAGQLRSRCRDLCQTLRESRRRTICAEHFGASGVALGVDEEAGNAEADQTGAQGVAQGLLGASLPAFDRNLGNRRCAGAAGVGANGENHLTKADVKRLRGLLERWKRDEEKLREHFGMDIIPNSVREVRHKDRLALESVLSHLEQEQ